jgi:flagellar hook-length control protein FliK
VKPELAPVPGAINGLPGMDGPTTGGNTAPIAGRGASATVVPPQARFVAENQPKIVTAIHGQLLPNGGTMQLRLNPPELGAVQVTVHMRDGVMSAAFETTSDHATRLLSHSLGDLKSGLEANGVSVEKLHVQQAPKRDADTESDGDSKQQPHEQQQQAQQDQQRREVVRRMWRKLAGDEDPLDMVA